MIKLYHGSIEIVSKPEIREPQRTLDFGRGFYLTTSEKQAENWAVGRARDNNISRCYVNIFTVADDFAEGLDVLRFESPSDEWIDFVMENRMNRHFSHNHDIVYGPVANDRVYGSLLLYEDGWIDKEELKKRLKAYKLVDQMLFHTPRSLDRLTYFTSKLVQL